MEILESWTNPKLFHQLHIHIRKYEIMDSDIQIRNRSFNCTLANIIGIVYFAACLAKVAEVVTWQVGYDTKRQRLRFQIRVSVRFSLHIADKNKSLKACPHWKDDSTRPLNWAVTDVMVN